MKLNTMNDPFEGQTYSGDDGVEYGVGKLVSYAEDNMSPVRIPMSKLVHNIDPENGVSADEPIGSSAFHKRAMKASLKHPVLLFNDGKKLWVIDGTHRIFKADKLGKTSLAAYVFYEFPLDARV